MPWHAGSSIAACVSLWQCKATIEWRWGDPRLNRSLWWSEKMLRGLLEDIDHSLTYCLGLGCQLPIVCWCCWWLWTSTTSAAVVGLDKDYLRPRVYSNPIDAQKYKLILDLRDWSHCYASPICNWVGSAFELPVSRIKNLKEKTYRGKCQKIMGEPLSYLGHRTTGALLKDPLLFCCTITFSALITDKPIEAILEVQVRQGSWPQ